jgi:hypothetical protein
MFLGIRKRTGSSAKRVGLLSWEARTRFDTANASYDRGRLLGSIAIVSLPTFSSPRLAHLFSCSLVSRMILLLV